jgi:hypothetical protein
MQVAFKALADHGEWGITATDGYIHWRTTAASYHFPINISVGPEEFLSAIKRDLGLGYFYGEFDTLHRNLTKWRKAIHEAETLVHERAISDAVKDASAPHDKRYRVLRSGHPTDWILRGFGSSWLIDSVSEPRTSWSEWDDSLEAAHEAVAEILGCEIHLTSLQKMPVNA